MSTYVDPITLEVVANKINGIVSEMQNLIFRTGYSTIIRESKDASAGLTDAVGRLVGQQVQHPLHVGVFGPGVRAVFQAYPREEIQDGDVFMSNNPYLCSPHASDLVVMVPVFYQGQLVAFACNVAHKPDIGGMVPGSASGGATEIYQEGIVLPLIKYASKGETNTAVERILALNSRVPEIIMGDLKGQIGCTHVGRQRLMALMDRYGCDIVLSCFETVIERTHRRARAAMSQWPDGTHEAQGFLDNDGVDLETVKRVHVRVTVEGDHITFDFSGSDPQARGPVNLQPHLVGAACMKSLVNVIDPTLPCNHGLEQAIQVVLRESTIVNPRFPAPCGAYFPTLQLTADVILHALGKFLPERAMAGNGTGGAISIGGLGSAAGQSYVLYEIIASATGARPTKDGISGISEDMMNCRIAPIEMLETEFPILVERFELIPDSGGPGQYRGGLGYRRQYRVLGPASFNLRSEKHRVPAWGVRGAMPGRTGACVVNPGAERERTMPSKFGNCVLESKDVILIERPGGGGYGLPWERDPERVAQDVRNGFVTQDAARRHYGVIIDPATLKVDDVDTAVLRAEMSLGGG